MIHDPLPTVLAIGVSGLPAHSGSLDVFVASTMRETMAMLRLVSFDLVLAGFENRSLNLWDAMERVLMASPSQRWILASGDVTQEEEILARSLGASLVLDAVPHERWLSEFIASQRRRQHARRIPAPASSSMLAGDMSAAVF